MGLQALSGFLNDWLSTMLPFQLDDTTRTRALPKDTVLLMPLKTDRGKGLDSVKGHGAHAEPSTLQERNKTV